jgi:septin family protein
MLLHVSLQFKGLKKQKKTFATVQVYVPKLIACLQIYQFPDCDSDEDEEFKQQDRELKACVPFAVVGSNTVIEVAGKKVRGRQYPWGVVEGEFSSDLPVLISQFNST